MRFLAVFPLIYSTAVDAAVCSEDIIRNAEAQGFISFIYNCVHDAITTMGSQACLAAFINTNASNNPFPITGACRDEYQVFVDALITSFPGCPQTSLEIGAIPNSFGNCLTSLRQSLLTFTTDTGFYPFRMCDGAQVRFVALSDPTGFAMAIANRWGSGQWVDPLTDSPACLYCYLVSFYNALDASLPSNMVEACLATSGPTELCLSTTVIIDAREDFLQCAGYDILVPGPMCSADAIASVQALIPAPYYTFAECAFHPDTPFCSTTQAYLNEIKADTSSVDCLACYTEFQSDIEVLAAADTSNICGPNVFSDSCVAYAATALFSFEVCSGFTLDTSSSTAAPVTAASTATDAPTMTTTTVAAATTGTAGPTTKGYISSNIAWIAALGIAAIL